MSKQLQQGLHAPPLDRRAIQPGSFEHEACGVGLVANIKGQEVAQRYCEQGLEVLINLGHQGRCQGADPETGDGAGIMVQMPHEFIVSAFGRTLEVSVPDRGRLRRGHDLLALVMQGEERARCEAVSGANRRGGGTEFPGLARRSGLAGRDRRTLSARVMPTITPVPGWSSRLRPAPDRDFDLRLLVIRKQVEKATTGRRPLRGQSDFYICSLSSKHASCTRA